MLSADAKMIYSPLELKEQYSEMTGHTSGPAPDVQVIQELHYWPGMKADDIAWIYVALSGATFSEAVSVIVCREDGEVGIRSVEWGRP